MKDQFGNELPAAEFTSPHGHKVDYKGNILSKVTDGLKKAADAVAHVAEAPFKHVEPAKPEAPAKAAEEAK